MFTFYKTGNETTLGSKLVSNLKVCTCTSTLLLYTVHLHHPHSFSICARKALAAAGCCNNRHEGIVPLHHIVYTRLLADQFVMRCHKGLGCLQRLFAHLPWILRAMVWVLIASSLFVETMAVLFCPYNAHNDEIHHVSEVCSRFEIQSVIMFY